MDINPAAAKRARRIAAASKNNSPLPVVLQLTIPFVKAGDLAVLAAVSRACRTAARVSYRIRMDASFKIEVPQSTSESPSVAIPTRMIPKIYRTVDEIPFCYKEENPWCSAEFVKFDWRKWEVQWRAPKVESPALMESKEARLRCPQELSTRKNSTVCRYSLRDYCLLVIVAKTLPNRTKELWGILYHLPPVAKLQNGVIHPLIAQPLPVEPFVQVAVARPFMRFGATCVSGNGQSFATITSTTEITVFDLAEYGFAPRCAVLYTRTPTRKRGFPLNFQLSLSVGGEILSMVVYDHWAVFDVRKTTTSKRLLVEMDGIYARCCCFTPDNDFVLRLENVTLGAKKIQEKKAFPAFPAQMIVAPCDD